MSNRLVSSKINSYARDLVGSVHIFSASDDFCYLQDCTEFINGKVHDCQHLMGTHNVQRFDQNFAGINFCPNEVLEELSHIDL